MGELKASPDTYREYEEGRLLLAVEEPTVIEMKEAVADERKITLHEEKLTASDGHADVLKAGRLNPSVRDELGWRRIQEGSCGNTEAIWCACCTTRNATSCGVSHEGEEAASRERRGTLASQRC